MSRTGTDGAGQEILPASRARDLPAWLYLGAPVATVLITWISPLLGDKAWYRIMGHHELSCVEIATVLFLLPAFVIGIVVARRFGRSKTLPRKQARTIAIVLLIGALGAMFFGGEEMSWGQSYLQWETPDSWKEVNKQDETNIHNLHLEKYGPWVSWIDDMFNNTPRQGLLVISILGAALPIVLVKWRRTQKAARSIWYWLIPTYVLIPVCVLAFSSTIPEKLAKLARRYADIYPADGSYVKLAFLEPGGELKEYAYGMMLLFYFLSLCLRTTGRNAGGGLQGDRL